MARRRKKATEAANEVTGCLLLLLIVGVPLAIVVPPVGIAFLVFGFIAWFIFVIHKAWSESKKPDQKNLATQAQQINAAARKAVDSFEQKFVDAVERKITEMQKEIDARKAQTDEYHEWIEFTYISGKKQIFCVGKEGWQCRCVRLNSNPDIIKVRRYSTEYPFDLIDTQGAMQSQHEFFEQVSLDKKTNTEKTTTKKLISWRLFGKQEFEQKCLEANGKSLNVTGVFDDDAISEKQWIEEIAAKKRQSAD